MNDIRKVEIPAAGLGTRMLPATKAIPKEMLPIIDKPIIQYVIEECLEAGFTEIILITHSSKNSIENHFDKSFELETTLEKRIKKSLLEEIKYITNLNSKIIAIRQGEALGLGHAIYQAKHLIANEPFGVVLPDRVMNPYNVNLKTNNLALMRQEFIKTHKSNILFEKVKKDEVSNFGIAKLNKNLTKKNNIANLIDLIEKPSINKAPSQFAAVGRYIFDPSIFSYISKKNRDKKEIELTDAIRLYIKDGNAISAMNLEGDCFDCGNKEGYLKAIIEIARRDKKLKRHLKI